MPSDIFAFIQAQPQAQTAIPTPTATTQTENTETLPGLFDSLITQYISLDSETIEITEAILPVIPEMPDIPEQPVTLPDIEPETEPTLPDMPEIPEQPMPITFSSNNSFSRAVIDVLAGETEHEMPVPSPEAMPETQEDEEEIIWFEDTPKPENITVEEPEAEVMPEHQDIQYEVDVPVRDTADNIEAPLPKEPEEHIDTPEGSNDIEAKDDNTAKPIAQHLAAPKEAKPIHPKAPAITDDDDDSDDTDDTEDISNAAIDVDTSTAGLAIAPQTAPQVLEAPITPDTPETPEADTPHSIPVNIRDTAPSQPQQVRTTRRENTPAPDTQSEQETPDTSDTPRTFRETLEARTAQHEESGQDTHSEQDTDSQNQGQDFGQTDRDSRGNTSRSRTDTRRTDRTARTETSRTQPERTSTATTHRTNSFQSFFEGAIYSRRTSQASATPMSLRETYNFTQAQTLRNGLVNVVRFIRADGVQKASVIVDPPALGRISVELTSGTSGVEATIKVASEQIRQLVQDQLSQLRMNLSRQGVQVAEFTVDVQQDNSHNQSSQDQDREQRRVNILGAVDEEEPEEFRVDLEEGLLYWLA